MNSLAPVYRQTVDNINNITRQIYDRFKNFELPVDELNELLAEELSYKDLEDGDGPMLIEWLKSEPYYYNNGDGDYTVEHDYYQVPKEKADYYRVKGTCVVRKLCCPVDWKYVFRTWFNMPYAEFKFRFNRWYKTSPVVNKLQKGCR